MITVHLFNTADSSGVKVGEFEEGTKVSSVLEHWSISPSSSKILVNSSAATLDKVLSNGDRITVSRTDLKGADEVSESTSGTQDADIIKLITEFGGGDASASSAISCATKEIETELANVKKDIIKTLLRLANAQKGPILHEVENIKKALEASQKHQAKFVSSVTALVKNENIFPFLAFAGLKEDAPHYCAQLGIQVPADDDEVWNA